MTDKVQKIIAYIDKLLEKYPKNYYLLTVAEFIDTLQEESVSVDLEEAALLHLSKHYDTSVIWDEDEKCVVRDFKAGAEWQKEKMMKDAVKVTITGDCAIIFPKAIGENGDKVKVIVIKED